MDSYTLEALEGSIAKWQSIVDGTDTDRGAENCALCRAFPGCDECPVAESTEAADCDYTPWQGWYEANRKLKRSLAEGFAADTDDLKKLAQAELEFLKSLRPSDVLPSVQTKGD